MKKINWKVRFRNPVFIAQLAMAILLPILTYMGLTVEDMTSWKALFDAFVLALGNPFVLGTVIVSVWNAINDPTTEGVTDSERALQYTDPKSDNE